MFKKLLVAGLLSFAAVSASHATAVTCGNASLGIRTTTVDPAMVNGWCYAGLTNLGDGAIETLINTQLGVTDADLKERDDANANGGLLSITGKGATSGGWSFSQSLWSEFDRLFLYFHFGDAADNPGPTSTTDPDIFIVELLRPDYEGTWTFSGRQGMSNIAVIGTGDGNRVPEPGSLALLGMGLVGLALVRRRRRGLDA